MRLIGMLDSPYVRRVAISLQLLGLRFEHRSLSVFRAFDEFHVVNPVVKAPTLVCDDGTVLMDSGVILEYAQARAGRIPFVLWGPLHGQEGAPAFRLRPENTQACMVAEGRALRHAEIPACDARIPRR